MINDMEPYLLQTKLCVPPLRSSLISRIELIDELNHGLPRKLTFFSAPAGFGKTTMTANWLQDQPVAWFALDQDDNEPGRFLTYLIAALHQQNERLGGKAGLLLQAQPEIEPTQVITALINDLATLSRPIFLILDDYHIIENSRVHELVAFLLDHSPRTLHLVITSRADPPFSIARWRAQGQVVEMGAASLRFSLEETTVFLNDLMQLDLAAGDIAALDARTEGWVASLQLAGLFLRQQRTADRAGLIQQFAGSHRYLIDYWVDEILEQLSEDDRRFLLQTSILRQFCAPLCDALLDFEETSSATTEQPTYHQRSQERLAQLEAANLFIIPLTQDHAWFRYHHLFAEFLQHRLHETYAAIEPSLHRQASLWYAENDFLSEAIDHAIQIPDYDRATCLLADHIEAMVGNGDFNQALQYINRLPADLRDSEQRLCLYHAWSLMFVGQLDECARVLARLEELPNTLNLPVASYAMVLQGYLLIRQGRSSGNLRQGILLIEQAFAQLAHRSNPDRTTLTMQGAAAVELAYGYTVNDEIEKAVTLAQEAIDLNLKAGNTLAGLSARSLLAQLTCAQGRWRQAADILQNGLTQAETWTNAYQLSGRRPPAAAPLLLGMGMIFYQWNDLEKATPLIEEADDLYALTGAINRAEGLIGLAQLRWAQAEWPAIEDIVRTLKQMAQASTVEFVSQRLDAAVIDWQIRLGQVGEEWTYVRTEIQAWIDARGLHQDDPLSYRTEFQYETLARAYCHLHQVDAGLSLLHRLITFAAETKRPGDGWRYQLLTVVAQMSRGEMDSARRGLQEIMGATEPEGIVRLYVDEGQPVATLLQELPASSYRDRLLAAFRSPASPPVMETSPLLAHQQALIESLSPREQEVLHLLNAGATNQQIAEELVISHATAKKHVSNILGKLGVENRTKAVGYAREIGLLD